MKQEYNEILTRILNNLNASADWVKPWADAGENPPDAIHGTPAIDEPLSRYYDAEHITYMEMEQDRAFYAPEIDTIVLPSKKQFKSIDSYSAARAHETIHSTGEYTRCNRAVFDEFKSFSFGDSRYSREELVAEIGACFLLSALGIDTAYAEKNASAYVANWLKRLNNNEHWIYKASALAEDAVEYILETIER